MQKKLTIQKIADLCGVSVATVSRVLNGKDCVRPEIRKKILYFVEDFGWDSNRIQSRIARKAVKHAVVVTSLNILDTPLSLKALVSQLQSELNYKVSVAFDSRMDSLMECERIQPELVVLYGISDLFADVVRELRGIGVRVIALGESFIHNCPIVSVDYRDAGRRAAQDLKQAGIEKIAFAGPLGELPHPKSLESISLRAMHDLLAGIMEIYPELNPARDAVSDSYGSYTAFRDMFLSGEYRGWIIFGSPLLNAAGTLPESAVRDSRIVALLTNQRTPVPPIAWRTYCRVDASTRLVELLKNTEYSEIPENAEFFVPFYKLGE